MTKTSMSVGGKGDMTKETYDPNADGIIAYAETEAQLNMPIGQPSADLKASVDAEVNTSDQGSYILVTGKALTLTLAGMKSVELRVKFSMKASQETNDAYKVYARIYKDGVAVGTERTDITGNYVEYSEDIEDLKPGEVIQIFGHTTQAAVSLDVKEFRIYGEVVSDDPVMTLA